MNHRTLEIRLAVDATIVAVLLAAFAAYEIYDWPSLIAWAALTAVAIVVWPSLTIAVLARAPDFLVYMFCSYNAFLVLAAILYGVEYLYWAETSLIVLAFLSCIPMFIAAVLVYLRLSCRA